MPHFFIWTIFLEINSHCVGPFDFVFLLEPLVVILKDIIYLWPRDPFFISVFVYNLSISQVRSVWNICSHPLYDNGFVKGFIVNINIVLWPRKNFFYLTTLSHCYTHTPTLFTETNLTLLRTLLLNVIPTKLLIK